MKTEKVIDKDLRVGDKVSLLENQPNVKAVILEVVDIDSDYVTMEIIEGDNSWFKFNVEPDGSIKFRIYGNRTYNRVKPPIFTFNLMDFIIGNLEFYPLIFCLLCLYHAAWDWRLWVTIISVSLCAGISNSYNQRKNK